MNVNGISNSPISEEYESEESPRAKIEPVKIPDWYKPDPKLLDPVWVRETMLKLIRSGMEGFVEHWSQELGGVHKIDPRLKGMSAPEVNQIYMSSLVEEPLEIIEQLYAWSRVGENEPDWIASYKRYMKALLDKRESCAVCSPFWSL
jgi:hypothetical protein